MDWKTRLYEYFCKPVAITVVLLTVAEIVCRLIEPTPAIPTLDWQQVMVPDLAKSEAYKGVTVHSPCQESRSIRFDARFQVRPGDDPADTSDGNPLTPARFRKYVAYFNPLRVAGSTLTGPGALPDTTFVLGGSTVAGDFLKCNEDMLSARLQQLAGKPFVNLGVSGYNNANEFALFVDLLKWGYRPGAALFYEGSNDATHRVAVGHAYLDFDEMAKGTMMLPAGWYIVEFLERHLALVRLLLRSDPRGAHYVEADDGRIYRAFAKNAAFYQQPAIDKRAARVAEETVRSDEFLLQLAEMAHVRVRFVLQPTIFESQRTAEEDAIVQRLDAQMPAVHLAHTAYYKHLRELSKRLPAGSFVDASDCLKAKARSVFVDFVHVSPAGNELIAQCLKERMNL